METVLKIAAIALSAVLCAVVVRKQTPEIGVALGVLAGLLIISQCTPALKSVLNLMDTLSDTAGISPAVVSPVIKTLGIGIITKLSADICRDAKESGVASFLETAGAVTALFVCVPLLETVLSMIGDLL